MGQVSLRMVLHRRLGHCCFLPGTVNLKIGVSSTINLSLLPSAASHFLFSSVSLRCKNVFPVDGDIATSRSQSFS